MCASPQVSSKTCAGVALAVFAFFLLIGGRERPWNDGQRIFAVAENLVRKGTLAIGDKATPQGQVKIYTEHPLLPSAVHLPAAALHRVLAPKAANPAANLRIQLTHIAPGLLAAAAAVMLLRLLVGLGIGAGVGSLAVGLMVTGTLMTIYGRVVWSEIAQMTAFLGVLATLLRIERSPSRKEFVLLGVWLGALVNTKLVFVLCLPGALWFALSRARRAPNPLPWSRMLLALAAGAAPFVILLGWYNWARSGSLLSAGYRTDDMLVNVFTENALFGVWSLFFSLGKGFFLYSPVLLYVFWPRRKPLAGGWWPALLVTAAPVVLINGKLVFWSGDWCWGPRYLLFLVPPLMIPVAALLNEWWADRRRWALVGLGAVALVGTGVQVLGASYYWDHYIRLSKAARNQWLGNPNRAGALAPDRNGSCDPCFEDFYQHNYTPAFQPMAGHYWFLKHDLGHHTWEQAEPDAPWRRYTHLQLDSTRKWYPWPPLDWWFLGIRNESRAAAYALLALFIAGLAGGIELWRRGLKGSAAGEPAEPGPSARGIAV